jgi:hypothetical protein
MGEKGKVWTTPFSPGRGYAPRASEAQVLILFVDLCVKRLVELGRKYQWQRPERCPKCQGVRVWGHGYVTAYFDEAGSQGVFLKRYRCGECRVVIRLRPSGYWRRIQAAVAAVHQCVLHRLEKGRWPPGCNAARGRHWLRALKRQVRTRLGMSYAERIAEGFSELVRRGVCAVSRAV